jgi:uncharacterized protein (DUF342 family)
MKKYFIAETDEEIEIGDTIQLDMTKKTRHGVHTVKGEAELNELTIPLLLEIGAIEEREVEEGETSTASSIEFDEDIYEALASLAENLSELEERIKKLEDKVSKLYLINSDIKETISAPKEDRTAKTKKK